MSQSQIAFSLKLDRAYEIGVIAFASGSDNILYPALTRADIQPNEKGEVLLRIGRQWYSTFPAQIKFCRRH